MKLYKYRSLNNLWHLLDILINNRLYCAHWSELNDPLEGRYEIFLGAKVNVYASLESTIASKVEQERDAFRIASLSADPTNLLMWAHYANGHKGVAVEIEIPDDHEDLTAVSYTPFSSVFLANPSPDDDLRHLFNGKSEEWSYEREYRIITRERYFFLPNPVKRLLIGPLISANYEAILREIVPKEIEIVKMKIDRNQGTMSLKGPEGLFPKLPEILR